MARLLGIAAILSLCLASGKAKAAAPVLKVRILSSSVRVLGERPPFVTAGRRVYFAGSDAAHGDELWTSDGTAAGTRIVEDIVPGPASSEPSMLEAAGVRVYFVAGVPRDGDQVWFSRGKAARRATHRHNFGCCASMTVAGRHFYVAAGGVLWVSDRSRAGIHVSHFDAPQKMTPFRGNLYFTGKDGTSRRAARHTAGELMRSGGTSARFRRLTHFSYGYSSVSDITATQRFIVFAVRNQLGRQNLWVSDGTPGGTHEISKDGPDANTALRPAGNEVFYTRTNAGGTVDLWRTDGTARGTQLTAGVTPSNLLAQGNNLFFQTSQDNAVYEAVASHLRPNDYRVRIMAPYGGAPIAAASHSVLLENRDASSPGKYHLQVLLPRQKKVLYLGQIMHQPYEATAVGIWDYAANSYIANVMTLGPSGTYTGSYLIRITVSGIQS